jgi:hypothetical protein
MGGSQGRMGEMKMHTSFWSENLKGRDDFECLGLHGRTACLKGMGCDSVALIHLVQSGQGPVVESCERDYEPAGSVKGREILG